MPTFYKSSCPASSGKTYNMVDFLVWLTRFEPVLVAQPTIELIQETIEDNAYRKVHGFGRFDGKHIIQIHSEDGNGQDVVERIQNVIQNFPDDTILFITHSSLMRLTFIPKEQNWNLFIDEIPNIDFGLRLRLPDHRDELFSMFDRENIGGFYERMKPNAKTYQVADNCSGDEWWGSTIKDLMQRITSAHWEVYSETEHNNKFLGGDDPYARFHGVLNPSIFDGFNTVTLLGAGMENSLLFKIWSEKGISFSEHPRIKPRFTKHENSNLIAIKYVAERDYSKTGRRKKINVAEDMSFIEFMKMAVDAEFAEQKYYLIANNDLDVRDISGQQISNVCHGLNSLTHFRNFAMLSALNETPEHGMFLRENFGITSDEIYLAITVSTAYQSIMRSSLRDPKSKNQIVVIVPDKRLAQLLVDHFFPDASIVPLIEENLFPINKVGRPRTGAQSDADRKRRSRENTKRRLIEQTEEINASVVTETPYKLLGDYCDYKERKTKPVPIYLSIFNSIYSVKARDPGSDLRCVSHELFVEFLKDRYKMTFGEKTENLLISPSVFDPDKVAETSRGLANIKYSNGIWLDNDGGDLTIKDFASIFPSWKMYIFNSFSSGKNDSETNQPQKRWRVYIPVTHLLTVDVYKHLVGIIKTRLANKKYYSNEYLKKYPNAKSHGFDESKFTPSALFYLPCKSGYKDSFFHEFVDESRRILNPYCEINRSNGFEPILDDVSASVEVAGVLETTSTDRLAKLRSRAVSFENDNIQKEIDKVCAECAMAKPGDGNRQFFILAHRLERLGVDRFDAEQHLRITASQMRSPAERRAEIKPLIKKIW